MLPQINTPKISEIVYKILKEKIVSKEFPPGERLNLDEIEIQLGISRTPLKEALTRLQLEGLIDIIPRAGTYITDPSYEDISESFDFRRILEVGAIEIGAQKVTDQETDELKRLVYEMQQLSLSDDISCNYPRYLELDRLFHGKIVTLSENKRLIEVHSMENLHSQMARVRYRRYEPEINITQQEHERILAALEQRDTKLAMDEIASHLSRAKRSLLNDMESIKNPTNNQFK